MYQDAAEQTGCKVCDVVNMSHLYEYLAVTENHVTDDFALAAAAACCVCGTGRSNSDASSSTVCEDHRNMRRRQLHQRPRQQHPEPKVRSVRGQQVQRSRITNTAVLEIYTNCVAKQCAEDERAANFTFCPAELYRNSVKSTNCTLYAAGMYQEAAEKTKCKVCDVVNVSHLYEYLAMTENHVTDDFALAEAAACCACGTGMYDSDANSFMVSVDHGTYGAGNYTNVHGNNSLNPKCDQCEASKFKEAESPTPPFWKCAQIVWRSSVRRARGQPTARPSR